MSKFTVYHWKNGKSNRVCIVPNHYCKNLHYLLETIELSKTWGLTPPTNTKEIEFQVLSGDTHARMMSIEFDTPTLPTDEIPNVYFSDVDKYPHLSRYITTP